MAKERCIPDEHRTPAACGGNKHAPGAEPGLVIPPVFRPARGTVFARPTQKNRLDIATP